MEDFFFNTLFVKGASPPMCSTIDTPQKLEKDIALVLNICAGLKQTLCLCHFDCEWSLNGPY